MKLVEIKELLDAKVACKPEGWEEVVFKGVSSADLLSDVLALGEPKSLLMTGLTNHQVVRTAEMLGSSGIVIVRGKKPDECVINLAQSLGITILLTNKSLFESSGILYENGLGRKI